MQPVCRPNPPTRGMEKTAMRPAPTLPRCVKRRQYHEDLRNSCSRHRTLAHLHSCARLRQSRLDQCRQRRTSLPSAPPSGNVHIPIRGRTFARQQVRRRLEFRGIALCWVDRNGIHRSRRSNREGLRGRRRRHHCPWGPVRPGACDISPVMGGCRGAGRSSP